MGWFYGIKLHISINDSGKILVFCITPGNIDDRNEKVIRFLTREMWGKLFADKEYMSAKLFQDLWERNIQLITKVKNKLMDYTDKLLLRKRAVIESVHDFLKKGQSQTLQDLQPLIFCYDWLIISVSVQIVFGIGFSLYSGCNWPYRYSDGIYTIFYEYLRLKNKKINN